MEKFLQFIMDNKYPIIGLIIAIIIIATGVYEWIVPILLIALCVYGGWYFQRNKDDVKEKIKNFIDKL